MAASHSRASKTFYQVSRELMVLSKILDTHPKYLGGARRLKVTGPPMKFSRTPCCIEKACPDMGEHTGEILFSLSGTSQAEIDELRMEKVI